MILINHRDYHSPWPIVKRHWRTTLPFLTVKKVKNLLLSGMEYSLGKKTLVSKPGFIKVEATNRCNLRCPGCLHAEGRTELDYANSGDMDFSLFKKIISAMSEDLVKVSLYVEGEPLLNPEIAGMIAFLKQKKIASVLSSHFNYITPELARALIDNSLTHLIISLDGYDEESYGRYRRGGSFDRVVENIKLIQTEKEKLGSKYPLIEIQAVKFDHLGETGIKKIKEIARELGADAFSVKEDLSPYYKDRKEKKKKCFWIYQSLAVRWNGDVQPCCFFYDDEKNNFGNLANENFSDIWNNKKFVSARSYFKNGKRGSENLKCYECKFFKY